MGKGLRTVCTVSSKKFCLNNQVASVTGVTTAVHKGRDIVCLHFSKAFDVVPSYILSVLAGERWTQRVDCWVE